MLSIPLQTYYFYLQRYSWANNLSVELWPRVRGEKKIRIQNLLKQWEDSMNSFNKCWKLPATLSQFSSVPQSCPTLCDPMNRSTPGLPVHHQLPDFTETHVHRVSDAIQPSHPLSSPSPLAPSPSQHQSLFQWVNSSHEVAKVQEFHFSGLQNYTSPSNELKTDSRDHNKV